MERQRCQQWKDALDAIQIRYPFLSASIRKSPGKRPFFEKERGASMPLRIEPLTDSLMLEEEMDPNIHKLSLFNFWDKDGHRQKTPLVFSNAVSTRISGDEDSWRKASSSR
jgi:hypothetical protein